MQTYHIGVGYHYKLGRKEVERNMKIINLDELIKKSNTKNSEIASSLGVSEKAVSEWRRGKKFPRDSALNYLFSKFGDLRVETDTGEVFILQSPNPTSAPRTQGGAEK